MNFPYHSVSSPTITSSQKPFLPFSLLAQYLPLCHSHSSDSRKSIQSAQSVSFLPGLSHFYCNLETPGYSAGLITSFFPCVSIVLHSFHHPGPYLIYCIVKNVLVSLAGRIFLTQSLHVVSTLLTYLLIE